MNTVKRCFLIILFVFAFSITSANAGTKSSSYKIGPSDILNIYVWMEPELTRDVTVMADGKITFPLIGEIMASGSTVGLLKKVIEKELKRYMEAPEVTVIVRESLSQKIYIIGKVNGPGQYPLAPDMTVLQALATAGGFAEWSDTKNILIIRRIEGKEKQILFNYKQFISGKKIGQNILLEPKDTIVVP